MASFRGKSHFVALVAEEIVSGIDCALRYWLGRIELEVIDKSLTAQERLAAIEQILAEFKALQVRSPENPTTAVPMNRGEACSRPARAAKR